MPKKQSAISKNKEMTFEEAMQRLDEIVQALSSENLSLEEGLKLYKEGSVCSQLCREKLENARHELEVWNQTDSNNDTVLFEESVHNSEDIPF